MERGWVPHKCCILHGFIIAIGIYGEYYKIRCATLKAFHPQITRNRDCKHSGLFLTTVTALF